MNWLSKFRSSAETFSDGSRLRFQHRYALRYFEGRRYIDVGFAVAVGMSVDRLIYVWSIKDWRDAESNMRVGEVSPIEREEIAKKMEIYCRERGWTYQRIEDEPAAIEPM
jgi:hypothetical protein